MCSHVYDDFQLLCMLLMGEMPFAMISSLTNDYLFDNERSPRCTFSLERCLHRQRSSFAKLRGKSGIGTLKQGNRHI